MPSLLMTPRDNFCHFQMPLTRKIQDEVQTDIQSRQNRRETQLETGETEGGQNGETRYTKTQCFSPHSVLTRVHSGRGKTSAWHCPVPALTHTHTHSTPMHSAWGHTVQQTHHGLRRHSCDNNWPER